MHRNVLTLLLGQMLFLVSAALAQAPAPGGATAPSPASGAAGGLADYWWIILVVLLAAAAIWYFTRGRNRV